MNTDIWFPFYYGDYLKDTMQLSAERHGIYLLLMIHCWQNGFIEDDIDSLSIISKVSTDNLSLKYILDRYFTQKEEKYYQKRITKERERAEDNKKKRSEKARKAANIRWKDHAPSNATSNQQAMPQGMPETCPSSSSSSSQLSSTSKPPLNNKEGEKSPSRKKFVIPTIFELKGYCNEKKYPVDCEAFLLHYESNGWLVGKNKMKSWKASLGTWNKNSYNKPEERLMTAKENVAMLDKKYGVTRNDS